jgi:O-succinylbenzoate synthase
MGRVGWGEIAPISWFGSETLKQALDFCQQLPPQIAVKDIFSVPTTLPACQFGFESAWEWGNRELMKASSSLSEHTPQSKIQNLKSQIPYSYLLPTGEAALQSWQTPWEGGTRTFKWKIGVASIDEELEVFNQLLQALPQSAQLRLDANGGLCEQEAHRWLRTADRVGRVEFLEQPLTPKQFDAMLEMSDRYSTPIALDESVATLDQLEDCFQRGWRGIFIIKAAIAGSPKRLRQFCREREIDRVFSSVFESAIAKLAALQLATELSNPKRAIGFGVDRWFNEDDETWLEHLWKD